MYAADKKQRNGRVARPRETVFSDGVLEPAWLVQIKGIDALQIKAAAQRNEPAIPLEVLVKRPFPRWKRVVDILGALAGIAFFGPLMLLVAAAVRITTAGPVFFKQQRAGHWGKPFTLYKFRTMITDAEEQKAALLKLNERQGPVFKMKDDPRITPVGRWLRRSSLDEIPQFFNVLKGDMSLVGPRPLPVEETEACSPEHRVRLAAKPGITCLCQITSRDVRSFDQWVNLDIEYIRKMSFWYDCKLLIMTIPAVLSRRGAY
jgi:lipopolysaccharide/colanic/teichoic acid biosynthesis glycosyltransferase